MTKIDESHPTDVAATTPDVLTMRRYPTKIIDLVKLSDKARRLGAAFFTQASRAIGANATYWAAPIVGAGGSVLVEKLGLLERHSMVMLEDIVFDR